jgi:hypothetical protein
MRRGVLARKTTNVSTLLYCRTCVVVDVDARRDSHSVSEHDSGKYLHVREDEPHKAAGDDHERLDLIPLQVVDLDVAKGAAHANLIRGSTIGAECEGKT